MLNTQSFTEITEKHTIYVLVRKDISLEQQIVQLGHAAAEAGRLFYKEEHGIASLIALAVPDKAALHAAQIKLTAKGLKTIVFHEPDFGIGDSALASQPVNDVQRKLFKTWPLWRPTATDFNAFTQKEAA